MSAYTIAMLGALTAMSLLASLFFLRYWRTTLDKFFLWFAGAFATFGVSWALLARDDGAFEHAPLIYAVRVFGFLQIAAAIVFKNWRQRT